MDAEREISDGEIVEAILDGRTDLFRMLVRRHQDALYAHAVRMVGHPDDAADMVQRAFVKGYRKLASCRNPENVGGWLFRICANLCKDFLKSPRRSDLSIEGAGATVVDDRTPADRFQGSELRARIEDALDRLSPEHREAFTLKHVEGCSYSEMAERLGVSVGALKMRVHRAREELQGLLTVYG